MRETLRERTESMNPVEFIEKKKRGDEHSPEELKDFVLRYVKGEIPDYQMSAWLMAVNFQGMTDRETLALVEVMVNSGEVVDLSHIEGIKVDKHSTGGVGDKVSLILAPLTASCGCIVPMISGRGLGHTGGTLDKLESIPGMRVNLSREEFVSQVERIGVAMIGQTEEIVPADRKMYALRDVTATVRSIPLICASILSKKIAEGIDALVLDVKTGSGAFLQEYEQSRKLAQKLKSVGEEFGLRVKAVITDMNQPLGNKAGNWLEVKESIEVLKGEGPDDLVGVTVYLTAWMLVLAGIASDLKAGEELASRNLKNGKAFEKFLELVEAQGGDVRYIENPEKYRKAPIVKPVKSMVSGYITEIDTELLGLAAVGLGAGRKKITDRILPEVGFVVLKKISEYVKEGEELCIVHAKDERTFEQARGNILKAYKITQYKTSPPPLFYETF